ncbi:S-adenosyl-methyltransferase MraW [Sediminispirochaeta smaragdinae DSM 11293]|uniref:Ribosomal RNA small subunit methyltransferase H n=2 Tax=Sediminispirochaeta TaxID=1911556 RepID=E1R5Q7_SEDSS|nr:S-adenosyl-methyltransferase MraW [Sediminispirochaeta smaragdinae DSM 11293]
MTGTFMDIVHRSVMAEEAFHYLSPALEKGLLVDCTLGEGGHSELFLSRLPGCRIVGLDADEKILEVARQRLAPFGERVRLFNTWFNVFFRDYPLGDERPDAVLFDLGISVFHYERSGRGFSFREDEPLDMRLEAHLEQSAADIINTYPEKELADLIFRFGEERLSRRFASAIVARRQSKPFTTTKELEEVIWTASPQSYRHGRIHPATRTFQALRIAVNGELARLESALGDAFARLRPGGMMGVISFHSLEDRIVKHFFLDKKKGCISSSGAPIDSDRGVTAAEILTKKPLRPTEEEVRVNAPSRSAKFRVVRKLIDEDR